MTGNEHPARPSGTFPDGGVGDPGVVEEILRDWADTGLTGSLLARNLATGAELGFDTERMWALASVVKFPLALVVQHAFETGELDPAEPIEIDPAEATRGPTGVGLFRHLSRIAAEDLLQLSLAVSDNAATDALLDRLPAPGVTARLEALGVPGILLRHPMRAIYGRARNLDGVDPGLALAGRTPGGGNLIPELDPNRANAGSVRALVDLLEAIWTDTVSTPTVCARVRAGLGHQLVRHRLAVELASDAISVASKTGTFLDLRHEVGVVEIDGQQIAIAALTRSAVPAHEQLEADFAIGHAARLAVDALRD